MDRADRILWCLSSALQGGDANTGIAAALAGELDALASEFAGTLDARTLSASGQSLDRLGRLYDLHRLAGETDTEFQYRIMVTAALYRTSGTISELQENIAYFAGVEVDDVVIYDRGTYRGYGTLGYGEGEYGTPWFYLVVSMNAWNVGGYGGAGYPILIEGYGRQAWDRGGYDFIREVPARFVVYLKAWVPVDRHDLVRWSIDMVRAAGTSCAGLYINSGYGLGGYDVGTYGSSIPVEVE